MNGREESINNLEEFMNSEDLYCLVNGTHKFEKKKFMLVFDFLIKHYEDLTILIRTNDLTQSETIFGIKKFKTGKRYRSRSNYYYVDSLYKNSQTNSPSHVDVVIVFPLVRKMLDMKDFFKDLESKNPSKIILITISDDLTFNNQNNSWVHEKIDKIITYDMLEDNAELHHKIKNREDFKLD